MKNSITGKHQGKVYKRPRNLYKNDEALALQNVLDKNPNEKPKNLTPDHTKKTFVWRGKTKIN